MSLGIYSSIALVVDGTSVILAPSATVEVRLESDGSLASIFEDADGATPITNPSAFADSNGRFQFYAEGVEEGYSVKVTKDASTYTLNNQQVSPPNSSAIPFTQSGSGATERTVQAKLRDVVNIKDFGVAWDGVTDDTITGQAAFDSGADLIYLPEGTGLGNWDIGNAAQGLIGDGQATVLKAVTADPVLTVTAETTANRHGRRFYSFTIDGNAKASHGVQYDVLFNNDKWDSVTFQNCDHAFRATASAIGGKVEHCRFYTVNYGLYWKATASNALNNNYLGQNSFSVVEQAAVYMDNSANTGSGGGNVFYDDWYETLNGFAVIMLAFLKQARSVNTFIGGWYENLAVNANTTLDDEGSVTTYAMWLDGGRFAFRGGAFPVEKVRFVDAEVTADTITIVGSTPANSFEDNTSVVVDEVFGDIFGGTNFVSDPDSSVLVRRVRVQTPSGRSLMVESYERNAIAALTNPVALTGARSTPNIASISGGVAVATAPGVYNGCGIRTVPLTADTDAAGQTGINVTEDKWYVWSLAARANTAADQPFLFKIQSGTASGLMGNAATLQAREDRWSTYVGVTQAVGTGTNTTVFNAPSGGSADIQVSQLQLVEFATREQAYAYADSTAFASVSDELYGSAALNFDLSSVTFQDLTITVTGAVAGDPVYLGIPDAAMTDDTTFFAWVSATNTVTVRAMTTTGTPDPASGTFKVVVKKL